MSVDINTRIWDTTEQLGPAVQDQMRRKRTEPWRHPSASTETHDEAMHAVQDVVILGFESAYLGASIPHEKVAEYVARHPGRYHGFAGIDPTVGKPLESLDRGLELGLIGVTVSPAAQGFHPADTRAMDLYEACEAKGVPIYFEAGATLARSVKMEFSQPYMLDEVARTFPNLKFAISSLGHPWIEQGLALIGKHPTVFADLSDLIHRPWQLYNALLMAYQQGATGQIVFGSGFPFCTPEKGMVTIYSVNTLIQGTHLPSVPREQLRSIVERDTLSALGIRTGPRAPSLEESEAPTVDPIAGNGDGVQVEDNAA